MSTLALRARLREKSGALSDLKTKAFADVATAEDRAVLKAALDDIKAVEDQLDLAEATEAVEAKHSKPATAAVVDPAKPTVPATAKAHDGHELSLVAAAVFKAKATGENAYSILENDGYSGFVDSLKGHQARANPTSTKAVNTLVSSEGGVLVPAPLMGGGIMPLLRKRSSFVDAQPTRVTLTNGTFTMPRGLAGATASYVAQGALKPVSTPTFDAISMSAKKLAGIVPITDEAARWAVDDVEAYVREDLRNALTLTLDLNAYLGTGAGASPLGILLKSGVQTQTATVAAPGTPTLAELDTLATAMILKLTTANIFAGPRWRWIMSYRTASRLSTVRVGANDGDAAFPEMNGYASGTATWKGFPVVVTSQLPTNGGATTDETTLALVDFSHVLFGEEEGIVLSASNQASLDTNGAGAMVHLWQQNMFAIRAEAMHDFGLRTALAVVKSTIRF